MTGAGTGSSTRRRPRAWPWVALSVASAMVVSYVADGLGWPWWLRGLLMGVCIAFFTSRANRVWQQRRTARGASDATG